MLTYTCESQSGFLYVLKNNVLMQLMRKARPLFVYSKMGGPRFSVQCLPSSVGESTGQPHTRARATGIYRPSDWLCFLTTCLTLMLGVGVGVALPITYSSPNVYNESDTILSTSNSMNLVHLPASINVNNIRMISFPSKGSLRKEENLKQKHRKPTEEENVISFVKPKTVYFRASEDDVTSGEAVQGIFWSQAVENYLPAGFDDKDAKEWSDFSLKSNVIRIEEGCGRMQNRLVTFESNRKSCARYRQNFDQIQGEIFSFYLSRLLGIRNVPPSSLGLVRPRDRRWLHVQSSLNQAKWAADRPIVYTQFLNDLEPAYIPEQFRQDRQLNPSDVNQHHLQESADRIELIALAQWSDLLVFDYLTANLDRMVNNLYNMQWNPTMMDSPAHNLFRDSRTGLLVFLDNESGLLHGYRLLDKYEVYHKKLLDSLCVFRRSTVESLRQLQAKSDVGILLRQMFEGSNQDILDVLPFLPEKSIKTLKYRIDRVLDQVAKCQSLYGL